MTSQLVAVIVTAFGIAAALGVLALAIAGLVFWSLEDR